MKGDPRWIKARFAGRCGKCEKPFPKGANVFYYPSQHRAYFGECGQEASRDFQAHAFDDAQKGAA